MGDAKAVTLPNTGAIGYSYDVRTRLIQRTDALNQPESWTYWPMGEVKTHTDRKGQTTSSCTTRSID